MNREFTEEWTEADFAKLKRETDMKAQDCMCGVKGCTGHEVVDGKITIPNHPLGHVEISEKSLADWHNRHGK